MANRNPASFRFPYDKYEDPIALNANFRYLQEFLRRLSVDSAHAYQIIVKPFNSTSTQQADVYLSGTNDQAAINELIAEGYKSFHFLDGTIRLTESIFTSGNVDGAYLFTGSGMGVTRFEAQSGFSDAAMFFTEFVTFGSIAMSDFTVDGNSIADTGINTFGTEGKWDLRAFRIEVMDCVDPGIAFGFGSGSPEGYVMGCYIHDNGGHGVHSSTVSASIIGNLIVNNGGKSVSGDQLIVIGNWFYGNGTDAPDGLAGFNNVNGTPQTVEINLDDIADVVITTVGDNEILQYDTGTANWVNQTLAEAGISAVGHTHTAANITDFEEATEDVVGGMVTGNTETGISVTYDDSDGTLDFVVDSEITTFFANTDITGAEAEELTDGSETALHTHAGGGGGMDDFLVDADTGTPETISDGQTLTIAGGTGVDTSVAATDTVTVALDAASQASLALADSATQPGDNISTLTNDAGYITATLTEEQVEDYVGGMVSGNTETRIAVTYEDADGTLDFVVDGDLGNYTNTPGFLTTATHNALDHTTAAASIALGDIGDVGVGTPSAGNLLEGDGDSWESVAPSTMDAADFGSGAATDGHVLTADGAGGAAWEAQTGGSGINNVVEDTTPQLGGNLDGEGFHIIDIEEVALHNNASGSIETGTFYVSQVAGEERFVIAGGTAGADDPLIVLFGGADSGAPNDIAIRSNAANVLLYDFSDTQWEFKQDVDMEANDIISTGFITNRPEVIIGRNVETSPVAIGTTATNIIAVTVTIPGHWSTYDVEAYAGCLLNDTSGGSTAAGCAVTLQMVHAVGNFNTSMVHEVMDLNYHDINAVSQISYVEGLSATGSRTFTWQMTRAATFTVSADQITLIVKAYRVT